MQLIAIKHTNTYNACLVRANSRLLMHFSLKPKCVIHVTNSARYRKSRCQLQYILLVHVFFFSLFRSFFGEKRNQTELLMPAYTYTYTYTDRAQAATADSACIAYQQNVLPAMYYVLKIMADYV